MTDYGDLRRAARGAADAGVLVPPVVVAADATALTLTLTPPAGARQAYVLLRRSAPGAQWESGESAEQELICYAPCGWLEDAGETPVPFPSLSEVIARAVAQLRGNWPDRRDAILAFLRADPFGAPRWADGLDWTMGAEQAAWCVTGSRSVAAALIDQPEFRRAWLDALAADSSSGQATG